jgi:sucrose-6-phosphate hydrolase SacC (GH32 family)
MKTGPSVISLAITIISNQTSKNPVKFLQHIRGERMRYYNTLNIKDIKLYHYFKNSNYNNTIIGSIYSKDINFGINIKYNIKQKLDDRKNKPALLLIEDDEEFLLSYYNKLEKEKNILQKQKKIENKDKKLMKEILNLGDILLKLKI